MMISGESISADSGLAMICNDVGKCHALVTLVINGRAFQKFLCWMFQHRRV